MNFNITIIYKNNFHDTFLNVTYDNKIFTFKVKKHLLDITNVSLKTIEILNGFDLISISKEMNNSLFFRDWESNEFKYALEWINISKNKHDFNSQQKLIILFLCRKQIQNITNVILKKNCQSNILPKIDLIINKEIKKIPQLLNDNSLTNKMDVTLYHQRFLKNNSKNILNFIIIYFIVCYKYEKQTIKNIKQVKEILNYMISFILNRVGKEDRKFFLNVILSNNFISKKEYINDLKASQLKTIVEDNVSYNDTINKKYRFNRPKINLDYVTKLVNDNHQFNRNNDSVKLGHSNFYKGFIKKIPNNDYLNIPKLNNIPTPPTDWL